MDEPTTAVPSPSNQPYLFTGVATVGRAAAAGGTTAREP
jgi:hypothetical protein